MIEIDGLEFTVSEKNALNELKLKLKDIENEKACQDTYTLYRFLKDHDFNVCQAEARLRKTLHWRQKMKVDTITTDYESPELLKKYFKDTRLTEDKHGSIVHFYPLGKMDNKGLLMSVRFSDFEKTYIQIIEDDEEILIKKRKRKNGPYPGFIYIYDMEGLPFATATDKKGIETFLRLCKMLQDNYPGRLTMIYLVNASSLVTIGYNIAKSVLNANLLKRLSVYGKEDWKDELLKVIDADKLPAFLGGTMTDPDGNPLCKTIVKQPAIIDESYYLQKSKTPLSKIPGIQKLVLARASFSEIAIEIKEAGSLMEWEFETKTCDIGFGLFFKEIFEEEEKITELVPLLRLDTEQYTETGIYKCEKSGIYVMLFDNSYSWIRSKEIYYRTKIICPEDHLRQMQK